MIVSQPNDGLGLLYHVVDWLGQTVHAYRDFGAAMRSREGDQRIFILQEPINGRENRWLTGAPYPAASCTDLVEAGALRQYRHNDGSEGFVAAYDKAITDRVFARLSRQPELTVWYGPMPESNGKSNFTAILMRKDDKRLDGFTDGITIDRSEYPERVRYEADRVRYLIGELDKRPDILAYDPDKHSGYVPIKTATEPPAITAVPIPAISIHHVKDETTSTYLLQEDLPFLVAIHDNGIFLTVPACAATADDEQMATWMTIPEDLRAVFVRMKNLATHNWFMLDVDGDKVPGLPVYE